MSTHVPLPSDEQLPPDVVQRLAQRPPLNVYRMAANAPGFFIPFTDLIQAAYRGALSERQREIAILRQGARAGAAYEVHQHRLIALSIGLNEAEIAGITSLGDTPFLSGPERLICRVCDQLETTATVDDETHHLARQEFGDAGFVELVMLVGLYCSVARLLNATRVPIEAVNYLADKASPN